VVDPVLGERQAVCDHPTRSGGKRLSGGGRRELSKVLRRGEGVLSIHRVVKPTPFARRKSVGNGHGAVQQGNITGRQKGRAQTDALCDAVWAT